MKDAGDYSRAALCAWAGLFLIGLGWEIWTLFASPETFPTLSAVTHFFEERRLGHVMLYVVWIWWGSAILNPGSALGRPRARQVSVIAAALIMGMWASSLPFGDPARWVALLLPAGGLPALAAAQQSQNLEIAAEGRSA